MSAAPTPTQVEAPASTVMKDIMDAFESGQSNPIPVNPDPNAPPAKPAEPEPPKTPAAPKPAGEPGLLPDPMGDNEPAAPVEPVEDAPADLSESAKTSWKTLRQKAAAAERSLKAAEAELQRIKSIANPDQYTKERETWQKERDDLLKRLQTTAVEKDPRFQAYFTNREANYINQAKNIAGEHGEKLTAILAMPEGNAKTQALDDILVALPASSQARIGGIINNLESLHIERQAELAKAADTYRSMQERQVAEQRDFIAKANSKLEDTLERWSDPTKGLAVFQKREGDEEWNQQVENSKALARKIFSGDSTMEEKARAAAWAAAAPQILSNWKADQAKLLAAEQKIAKLSAAQPSVSSKGPSTQPSSMDDENVPLHVRIMREAANQGAFSR